jgi:capsular exopolysaccharide synthesis family protein
VGGGTAAAGDPPELAFKRLFGALLRYKWMILLLTGLGGAAGVVAGRFQDPTYEVTSQIWIESGALFGTGIAGPITQGALLTPQAWASLLLSATVLDSVVLERRLYLSLAEKTDSLLFANFQYDGPNLIPGPYRLEKDASGRITLADAEGNVHQQVAPGDSIGAALGFRWVPDPVRIPADRAVPFTIQAPGEVSAALARRVVTQQGRPPADQSFLGVILRGPDRFEIAATLNSLLTRFDSVALRLKRDRLTERSRILKEQLDKAEAELTAREAQLQGFKVGTITLPTEDRGPGAPLPAGLAITDNTVFGNFFLLNTQKDQLSREQLMIRRALSESRSLSEMVTALEFVPSVQANMQLRETLKEAATLENSVRVLRQDFTDLHPQVAKPAAQLDSLRRGVIPTLASQLLEELGRREADYGSQIANASREMQRIPPRVIQNARIQRLYEIADDLYRRLQRSHQEAELAELTTTPDIEVIYRPGVPLVPIDDKRMMILLAFLAGGLGLGLVGAIIRDRFDRRVLYPEQVTGGLGLNILGAVPALRTGRLGASDMALAVEAFRSIQLSLMHTNENGGPLMLTFSSPGASDGKSFITSNLAIAFADMGHRTLVIDGDLRRGTMHRLLDAPKTPGLTEYLAGTARRGEIIQETKYPLLYAITAGSRGPAGPKMLGSPAMRQLMRDLKPDFDVILVDSPPLAACVDPMILGTLTRNLVLVLRTGSTDRQLAESKLDMLDRLPVRVVGAILNDVERGGAYKYYSYISGYEPIDEPEAEARLPAGADAGEGEAEPARRDAD